MSDSAFAIGSIVRFHRLLSRQSPEETQSAVLQALHHEGFTIETNSYEFEGWNVRYGVIGSNSASTRNAFLLEVVPLLSLVGVGRPFARCAVPVAVRSRGNGAQLFATTVWGHRGDAGTVNLVAKRTKSAIESAAAHLGAEHSSSVPPIDPSAPIDGRSFERLTGWRQQQ
ncbi:hypothetical protein ACUWEX_01145 [Okibacterium fritillariae]|uniref:Uncharacterized protein n=1 Tax=Okibacterium fritillariae TaxID=123320 RepID=A0A1T5IBJ1_9MICO|nr:hypothetical protein [Okibacterium fritillariae]SKC36541.1 hypothetical protein SAMN06309945_0211 [Okibacterium fritillariae]